MGDALQRLLLHDLQVAIPLKDAAFTYKVVSAYIYISLGRDLLSLLSQKFLLYFTSLVSLLPPPERSVSNPEETARQGTLGPNWPVGRPPSEVSGLRLALERVDFPHSSSYQGGYKPRKD